MKGNFKAKGALALLDSNVMPSAPAGAAQKWSRAVAEQINEIARAERMTPRRAIAVGLMLHSVKASLKHGEFRPWLSQMLTGLTFWTESTAKVNSSYYMRLALAFVEQTKPTANELAALPASNLRLDLDNAQGAAAKLVKRLDEFCGEASLQELLEQHGIKNGGGGAGGKSAAAVEALPADDNTLLQEVAEWLVNLRKTVVSPETLKRLTPAQLADMETQMTSTLEDFRKAREALRG